MCRELVLTYFLPCGQKASPLEECHVYTGVEVETENLYQQNQMNAFVSNKNLFY